MVFSTIGGHIFYSSSIIFFDKKLKKYYKIYERANMFMTFILRRGFLSIPNLLRNFPNN